MWIDLQSEVAEMFSRLEGCMDHGDFAAMHLAWSRGGTSTESVRKWRRENPKAAKAYARSYYLANREDAIERAKARNKRVKAAA